MDETRKTFLVCCPASQHIEVINQIQRQGGFLYSITIVPMWAGGADGKPVFRCGAEAAIVYQAEKEVVCEIKC
jgi:hypothetical protein